MATTGPIAPGSVVTASEDPWMDNDWTTPGNITADDGNTASVTASTYDAGDQTYVLKAYGFNFSSIPDGATINGVICVINSWYATVVVSVDLMQLLDVNRGKVGTNQCATPVALGTGTGGTVTKGSSTDTWGNSLTAAWVKDADFGVALGFIAGGSGNTNNDVYVDYVTLEVYYTAAAPQLDATTASFTYTAKDLTGLRADRKLSAETKTYAYTAKDLTGLQVGRSLAAEAAAFSYTAKDLTGLQLSRVLNAETKTYAFTPIDITLAVGQTYSPLVSAHTFTGKDVVLQLNRKLTAQVATFSETPIDVIFNRTYVLFPEKTTFVYTPIDIILARGRVLNADVSAFTYTPIDVGLLFARNLATQLAQFNLSGIDAGLLADRKLSATTRSYAFTPIDVLLEKISNKFIDAITSAFTLSGINTILKLDRILSASTSAFTYTPIDVALLKGLTLNTETQSFIETVKNVDLMFARKLSALTQAYNFTPIDVTFPRNRAILTEKATFVYSPIDITFLHNRALLTQTQSFNFTPIDVWLKADRNLSVLKAEFDYIPIDVVLDWSGEVTNYVLDAETVAFLLATKNVDLLYSGAEVDGTIMTPALRAVLAEAFLESILMSPIVPASATSVSGVINPSLVLSSLLLTPGSAVVNGASFNPNALGGVPTQAAGESKGFFKF